MRFEKNEKTVTAAVERKGREQGERREEQRRYSCECDAVVYAVWSINNSREQIVVVCVK